MEQIYPKWRDLAIDPFEIKYNCIKLKSIVNYPPAGNDVVEAIAQYNNKEQHIYIKIERSKMAFFTIELNHINKLINNNLYSKVPKIIEDGIVKNKKYIVLEKVYGKRLSEFIDSISTALKKEFIMKYGMELGKIHQISIVDFPIAVQRIINDYPKTENYKEFDSYILEYINYLKDNKPEIKHDTFIHGDFHYANILWKDNEISGVLDFEYSGVGFKEQDIAWALVLRPNQKFMNRLSDIKYFLKGYNKVNTYDSEKLKWCLINGYCHFYLMNLQNKRYIKKIKNLLELVRTCDL